MTLVIVADGNPHRAFVNDWLAAAATSASADQLLQLFVDAFDAVWTRSHVTLGEVTLTAIVDRVVYDAAERHPLLSALEVEPTGLGFERLLEQSRDLPPDQIAEAIRTVLVEFLTVLGNLTAEILTPALHSALSRVEAVSSARVASTEGEDDVS